MSPTAPVLSLGIEAHNDQPPATTVQSIAKSLAKSSISQTGTGSNLTSNPSKPTSPSAAQPMLSLGLNKPAMDSIEAEYEPPTVSMAEDCNTEDFNKKSFALKRTRSMGVFDDYIRPPTDLVGKIEDYPHLQTGENNSSAIPKPNNTPSNGHVSFSPSSSSTSLSTAKDSPMSTATVATTVSGSTSHSAPTSQCDDISGSNSSSPSAPGTPDLPNDDSVIHHTPQRFVDYFSHDWKESDVSSCWRYIVLRRKDVANSARLENASWRTWTKAKYNLKTVAPESVNWLKDYDVTWLYGPLYDEKPHSFSLTGSADDLHKGSEETPDTSKQPSNSSPSLPATKPILKKKTAFELLGEGMGAPFLTHSACNGTPNCSCEYHYQKRHNHMHGHEGDEIESSNYLRHHNYRHRPHTQSTEYISNTINKQYSYPRLSEERLSTPSIHSSSSGSSLSLSLSRQQPPSQPPHEAIRSVHFNDRVDQCMAIDGFDSEDEDSEAEKVRPATPGSSFTTGGDHSDDEDGDDDSDSDGEDDDGLFLMVRSASSTSLHQHGMAQLADTRSESYHSDANSTTSGHSTGRSHPHPTITLLPAARLKYKLDDEEEAIRQEAQAKSVAYSMMHQSSYNTERRGGGASRTYDYNSVYTSPGTSPNQSPYPSISYKMNEVDTPIKGPSTASTRSASSQHTTTDNVMGHVQLSPNGSATGLLGKLGGTPSPSSYGSETEFVEDTGVTTPQQYESHIPVSYSPEGDVVDLSFNDQEALRNLARGDQANPSGPVYDSGRLGSAVKSAKKLWKASTWKPS